MTPHTPHQVHARQRIQRKSAHNPMSDAELLAQIAQLSGYSPPFFSIMSFSLRSLWTRLFSTPQAPSTGQSSRPQASESPTAAAASLAPLRVGFPPPLGADGAGRRSTSR